MASWSQLLWAHKLVDLNELLNSQGVLYKLVEEKYDPRTVQNLLELLATLTGRPIEQGQGELCLLLYPSMQGYQFFQNQQVGSHFIPFPDRERLVMLYIHYYTAPPQFIALPEASA
jgi:hypothetical protein